MSSKIVGILGGGQLGRMLASAASLLNIKVVILDVGPSGPAKQVVAHEPPHGHIDGSFTDPAKIQELASKVDVLTVEIEHVDVGALEKVQEANKKLSIHPSPATIRIIQDKYIQKKHLSSRSCPVSEFINVDPAPQSIEAAIQKLGLPLMLKSRTLAYDGRGNYALRDRSQVQEAIAALGDRPLYAEKWVPFAKEVAVLVVRTISGEVRSYPTVETVHKDNICHLVFAPFRSSPGIEERARSVAEDAVKTLEGAGVFAVEMFLMDDGALFINEIAPRPHNSGHFTIEACYTSQYSNHLRAILSLPLGSTELSVPSAAMLNIIGVNPPTPSSFDQFIQTALGVPGAHIHLYGKSEVRKGRKMGHVTVVAESDAQVRERLRTLLAALPSFNNTTNSDLEKYTPLPTHSHPHPLVGIIMGSDSDLPTMLPAARIMDRFNIPYELTIVSAHRTPDRLVTYSKSAVTRGLRCIIAGAGGAAHLPGMVAAISAVPVIGVPVKGSILEGVDSLYSIVQMPRGIPVATVAINNSMNAGLLAVRILAAGFPRLFSEMEMYLETLEKDVMGKVDKLEEVGWEQYVVKK